MFAWTVSLIAEGYCARCIKYAYTCNRCEQQKHLPTTVNSMLSKSKAMKTMNRISLRDCLSSLSHVNKLKSLRASNSPILIKSNCQRASEKDPATEPTKKDCQRTSVTSKHYQMFNNTIQRETWGDDYWYERNRSNIKVNLHFYTILNICTEALWK